MKDSSKILWVLKKAFKYCLPYILVFILILTATTVIRLLLNVVNKNIVNELTENISGGTLSAAFIALVVAYMVLYFVERASGFLGAFGTNFFRLNVDELFQKIFMWKSYNTPQEKFFDSDFMKSYYFVAYNVSKIRTFIGGFLELIFSNVLTAVGTLILFAIYEPYLIIYPVIVGAASFLVNKYISSEEYKLEKNQINEQRFHDYYKQVLTDKSNAKEIRLYNFGMSVYNKWILVYQKLRMQKLKLSIKQTKLYNINNTVEILLKAAATAFLLVGVYYNRYDIGTFVLLFGLIQSTTDQFRSMVYVITYGAYKDSKYLCDYYDFVYPISDEEIKSNIKKEDNDPDLKFGEFLELKAEGVSYTYPNSDRKAVDNVSFTIKKGQIVSILGYNGSGKTTLSKILNGSIAPHEGKVFINDTLITDENKSDVFKYYGTAPQDFSRFSLPVKDFVGLGFVEFMNDGQKLDKAYKKAGVESFINNYKKGDETTLGKEYDDEGVDLSGGEWQRLIIASAYMGEHEILLMDEPTASIDPLKEMELIRNFRENITGKTAILISHRIGFARLADIIVIMKDGKIVEQGTHEELLSIDGEYRKLFDEQKKLYEEGVA